MIYLRIKIYEGEIYRFNIWKNGISYEGDDILNSFELNESESDFIKNAKDRNWVLTTISKKDFKTFIDRPFDCEENLEWIEKNFPECFL